MYQLGQLTSRKSSRFAPILIPVSSGADLNRRGAGTKLDPFRLHARRHVSGGQTFPPRPAQHCGYCESEDTAELSDFIVVLLFRYIRFRSGRIYWAQLLTGYSVHAKPVQDSSKRAD